MSSFADHQFMKTRAEDLVVHAWFERDRAHVRLETPAGHTIFELWDEEVLLAVESGFLPRPRGPRPSDGDWLQPAIEYAKSQDLLEEDGSLPSKPKIWAQRRAEPEPEDVQQEDDDREDGAQAHGMTHA